jgi:16S rRNA processing protein RimM
VSDKRETDYPDLTWLGTVIGPHGIQGELKIYPLTEDPEFYIRCLRTFIREYDRGFEKITIKSLRVYKGIWILKCEECKDRNLAEKWKKSRLLIDDADLRPLGSDEIFLHQIKGTIVLDQLGNLLGEVVEIIETGAGHVYSVQQADGRNFLVPASGNIVQTFDSENRKLVIDPIPGLLES